MKKILFLILCLWGYFNSFSQDLDSLLLDVTSIKNDSIRIRKYNRLASSLLFSDAKKALALVRAGERDARDKNFAFGLIELTNTHGIYMDITGVPDSAEFYFNKALKLSREHDFQNIEVMCLNNLGMFNWNQSDYNQALNFFFQSLKMYENQGNEKGSASPLNNIGLVYQDMNLPEKALEYHYKALDIRKKYHLDVEQVASLNNIGINLRDLQRYREAVQVLEESLDLAKKTNNKIGYFQVLDNLAGAYQELDLYDKAISYYFMALDKPEDYEFDEREHLSIYINLISLYNRKNQPKEALVYAEKAFKIIEKFPLEKKTNSELYLNAAESYFMLYDMEKARKLTKQFVTIKDSLFSAENAKAVADLEVKYDTEKKEKQILIHRAELAEQRLVIQNKSYQVVGVVTLAIILALGGFLLYNQQKLKNNQLKKENELKDALVKIETQNKLQEQRLRISRDLHDNIGAQLTFIISSLDNLSYGFNLSDEVSGKLKNISNFTSTTIYELRDTIWAMNKTDITLEDLQIRISNFIEKAHVISDNVAFACYLDKKISQNLVFDSVEGMNIYRIIQEAINNAVKYAHADKIEVAFQRKEGLSILVRDNGVGFDIHEVERGNGLNNMAKRAQEIGAEFHIDSGDQGTVIEILIPTK